VKKFSLRAVAEKKEGKQEKKIRCWLPFGPRKKLSLEIAGLLSFLIFF